MPTNLMALCRPNGALQLKRVKTVAEVQNALEVVFATQEQQFNEGVTTEIPFDGGWKPDKHEVLVAAASEEMASIWNASGQNIVALPEIDASNFQTEAIKGLVVVAGQEGNRRLLIQSFSARQLLERSFAFILSGDTFRRLSEPAFTLGTNLAGILDAQSIRFKSYSNVRIIFDLASMYAEATDAQIETFAQHPNIAVADVAAFKGIADQGIRKLVSAISARGTLDLYDVAAIGAAATELEFPLMIEQNRIVFPGVGRKQKNCSIFWTKGCTVER